MIPDLFSSRPTDIREYVLVVHERLCEPYDCPIAYFRELDPPWELIGTMLGQRTRNRDSGAALRNLMHRYSLEELRDAPTPEVQELISMVNWPELKAPRIQEILQQIQAERGELSLHFLCEFEPKEGEAWLQRLPGVGPKTAAATLSFSNLRMRALPVDSHHLRVATRLGFVRAKIGDAEAHRKLEELLPADWNAQAVYDHHEVMMLHGQRVCTYASPACAECVLRDLCPSSRV